MRHLPNLISLLRIALIWPIVASLEQGAYPRTLLLLFTAAFSDGLDGFLAKRYHWTSELGKVLDPAGDKPISEAIRAAITGEMPGWRFRTHRAGNARGRVSERRWRAAQAN